MTIRLDYAAQERPEGTFVKPFCYAVEDGDAPLRDANYALRLVRKFTERLPGEYATTPPGEGWRMVFRMEITVENVRGKDAIFGVGGYRRFAFEGRFNPICEGYMELYRELKGITRRAKSARDRERAAKMRGRAA